MSKTNVRRPQKKTTIKKRTDWDVSADRNIFNVEFMTFSMSMFVF